MRDGFIRASDADRDQAARRLRDHAVAGRLDTDELDERSGRAYAARTLGELDELFVDLPRERRRAALTARPSARPARRSCTGVKLATASVVALVVLQGLIWALIGLALASIAALWLLVCVGTQLVGSAAAAAAALRSARTGRRPGLTA